MKRLINDVRVIFTALQACSVIAVLAGLWMTANAWPADLPLRFFLLAELALWCVMWTGFLRMCGRLKREPSAFTARNAGTLLLIAICCGLTGLLLTGEMLANWVINGQRAYGQILSLFLFTPLIFFGVTAVALVLRRMLLSAMALQRDNDLTI